MLYKKPLPAKISSCPLREEALRKHAPCVNSEHKEEECKVY